MPKNVTSKHVLWIVLVCSTISLGQPTTTPQVGNEDDLLRVLLAESSIVDAKAILDSNRNFVTLTLYDRLDGEASRFFNSGEHIKSLTLFETAHETARLLNERRLMARASYQIGRVYYAKGEVLKAIDAYLECKLLLDEAGTPDRLQVAALNALSDAYARVGDYTHARECAQRSLSVATTLEDKNGRALAQLNLGKISSWEGDHEQALSDLDRSLRLFSELNDTSHTIDVLMQIGIVHRQIGNFFQAYHYYNRAMGMVDTSDQRHSIQMQALLTNLSNLYADQRDYESASRYTARSLQIATETNDQIGIFTNLNNLGAINLEQGNNQQALSYFRDCLRIAEQLNSKEFIIDAQAGLGAAHHSLGQYPAALSLLNRCLQLSEEIGYRPRTALILWQIAKVHHSLRDQHRAIEFAERATHLANQLNMVEMSYLSLTLQGEAHYARREFERAGVSWTQAISRIEHLQTNIAGGEYAQQRFFENKLDPYHGMVSLLVEQNNPLSAFVYAERAKARVLLDVLRRGRVDINRALTADERAQEVRLNAQIRSLNSQLFVENQRQPPNVARIRELDEALRRARSEYEELQTRLFVAHPELAAQRGQIAPITTDEMAPLIPAGTAVLEYVVTEQKTYLFVLTKQGTSRTTTAGVNVQVFPLRITSRELAVRVAAFRTQLAQRNLNLGSAAHSLYDLLLKPAEQQLAGKTTLCIVPDGPLWELPFQALRITSARYLIEDYAVFYTPSLSVLREMQRRQTSALRIAEPDTRTLLAFGNPSLGNDTVHRLSAVRRGKRLVPLPEAENEVRILSQFLGAGRSRVYTGREAREERFKAEAGNYRVLHFATHGLFDDINPMYSHVLLAQGENRGQEDGLLEAREILNLDLTADLVVLSACETARGRIATGEGVIGMTWALFVAGCPATVASQWNVESASTSQLMIEFYRNLARSQSSSEPESAKATALRQASLRLLGSSEYNHPYYWAGFVLVGDAR